MPVPLTIAAPAALAGLAYVNARASFGYDYKLFGNAVAARIIAARAEKKDRLNLFYVLEENATGKFANNVCMIYEGRKTTFKEAYEIALKYGAWFKTKHGVKSKEVVAMDFTNSDNFILIWMGLWSIGAKPAFINYNLTSKALAHCITVSTTRLVLVDPEIQDMVTQDVCDAVPNVTFEVLTPEIYESVLATEGIRVSNSERSEDLASRMAVLIYTSGTTGLPKPAVVSWSKATVGSNLVRRWMGVTPSDKFYTCMPLYHSSAAVMGWCTTLNAGATLVIGKKFSTKTFWKDCRETDATIIQYVGETCRYLLSAPPDIDPQTGENLDQKNKVKIAFGNGLRPDVWNPFKERFGIETVAEFYSATESSSGAFNLSKNEFSRGAIGRLGSLASLLMRSGNKVVALDHDTEMPWRDPKTGFCKELPAGDKGEMIYKLDPADIEKTYQGYFNSTDATEKKIIRDVFTKGDAWFRTGDVMIVDSENRTYFSDRIGDTFRWKAENVSTNEVAEALSTHPSIQEANVYGVELPNHDGRAGCAAVVLKDGPSPSVMASIAEHASKELPKFAVPSFIRLTKEMQTTGTIKHQKHVIRGEGVDPEKVGRDPIYWLKNGVYVSFLPKDWKEIQGGSVKL